jgi:hypothetical protein
MKKQMLTLALALTLFRCGTAPAGDANPSVELRKMILSTDTSSGAAVIMDAHSDDSIHSLMSSTEGDASIYVSTGGVVIGGGRYPSVRAAAIAFVKEVMKHAGAMQPASEYPYPAPGHIRFYLRAGGRTSFIEVPESELAGGTHTFSAAYGAAEKVIAEYEKAVGAR